MPVGIRVPGGWGDWDPDVDESPAKKKKEVPKGTPGDEPSYDIIIEDPDKPIPGIRRGPYDQPEQPVYMGERGSAQVNSGWSY